MTEKTCTKCGETKPVEKFRVNRRNSSGRGQPCGKCHSKASRASARRTGSFALQWQRAAAKLRQRILDAYGNRCACCGETTPEFLTVDHFNNDGAEHRKLIGHGNHFYKWLAKHGFPQEDFQLLCWNCNCAKGRYGACPHMAKGEADKGRGGRPRT